jgi:hypothetical protein
VTLSRIRVHSRESPAAHLEPGAATCVREWFAIAATDRQDWSSWELLVRRRRFDHMNAEISVAAGYAVPRYALWLRLHELGWDPETLTRSQALAFCDGPLAAFLADHGVSLARRARQRLRREIRRFEPAVPTPYERLAGPSL